MRIVDTYEVSFGGLVRGAWRDAHHETLIVQSDDGGRQEVRILDQGNLVSHFRWMSDNDCLRHLRWLEPRVETNGEAIEAIERANATATELAFATNTVQSYRDPITYDLRTHIPGLREVPQMSWQATWTFWSREHAVLMKLTLGGSQ